MTHEEKMELHNKMHTGSKMILERVENVCRTQSNFTWTELMYMADILKDLAEMEASLAKAHHYAKECPERTL